MMEKQEPVYITGHRHPDTDSVVSAIAYAFFKRAMGIRAVPCRLGELSNETRYLLERFGYEPPFLLEDARKRLSEITIDSPIAISPHQTIYEAIRLMREYDRYGIAITDEADHLLGYISKSDIANMGLGDTAVSNDLLGRATAADIASVTSGRVVYDDPEPHLNGKISIIALAGSGLEKYEIRDRIVILGNDPDAQKKLIEKGAGMLIIVWADRIEEDVIELARQYHCPLVLSGHGTMNTSRYVFFAPQVQYIMNTTPAVLKSDEFAEDAGRKMLKSRFRSYPVVDQENHLCGYASRFHIMTSENKKVIMVDHNEFSQSVRAIEKAQILEVVDHHRISDFATSQPVSFRNEIVGSTATIIATMFRENQIPMPKELAGLLLGAVLSDTLIFQSPTTTKKDIDTANILGALAGLDPEEFGKEMFETAITAENKTIQEQIVQDIKYYEIAGLRTMISQVMINDPGEYRKKAKEIQFCLDRLAESKGLDLLVCAFTSVTYDGTVFFAAGEKADKCFEAYPDIEGEKYSLQPGILSRKLQILPELEKIL